MVGNIDLRWNHSFIQQTCINGPPIVSSCARYCELIGGLTEVELSSYLVRQSVKKQTISTKKNSRIMGSNGGIFTYSG